MIEIKFNDATHIVSVETFRRILNIAREKLSYLEQVEGRSFPKSDKAVLDLIGFMQVHHKELI